MANYIVNNLLPFESDYFMSQKIVSWLTVRFLFIMGLILPFGTDDSLKETKNEVKIAYSNKGKPDDRFYMLNVLWAGLLVSSVVLMFLFGGLGLLILPHANEPVRHVVILIIWVTFVPLGILSVYLAFRAVPADYYARSWKKHPHLSNPTYKWFHNIYDAELVTAAIIVWAFCYLAWWQNYG